MIEINEQWAVIDHWWSETEEVSYLYAELRVGDDKCIVRYNRKTREFELFEAK